MVPDQLELTSGILRSLMQGLTPEQTEWKPAPDRFSIAEVLAHLAHAEAYAYLPKYQAFAREESPVLDPYDTDKLIQRGEFAGKDAGESLAEFERLRAVNVSLLRSLPKDYAARAGHHRKVGTVRLSDLINECAYHDLGHIRQIAELVRARKYYPNMGLYARYYRVSP